MEEIETLKSEIKKRDKQFLVVNVIALIIVLVCVIFVGYNEYNKRIDTAYATGYNLGVQQGQTAINDRVIEELSLNGFITVKYPINETSSMPLRLVPMQQQPQGNKNVQE